MNPSLRRIVLTCLNPSDMGEKGGAPEMPNFGIRRIQAALVGDPNLRGAAIQVIERNSPDLEGYVDAIAAADPDVLGFTAYVWSFAFLVNVAREVRRRLPRTAIVFGGPSARPEMFALKPYADAVDFIDAIALGEGEETIREIVRSGARDRNSLARIAGLAVPHGRVFVRTRTRPGIANLDQLPSPFALGLMPAGSSGYLETYRGCPMGCSFCEWGVADISRGCISSTEALILELEAIARFRSPFIFLLDAGLNLNERAFRILREAARRTGFFRNREITTEIYPSRVSEEHLDFLASCGSSYLGVGLQSMDAGVLDAMNRPFNSTRFEATVRELRDVGTVEIQIILGLPTDTPRKFQETLERARALDCNLRVYHCLVLPDALLTRGTPNFRMEFDPLDLKMISCAGWSREDLQEESERLSALVRREGGSAGRFWWSLPGRAQSRPLATPTGVGQKSP